jgi:DNA polymerase-3 subunit delta
MSQINHTAFFQLLKAGLPGGAYLFHGAEEHVKRSALQRLRDAVLPEGLEALCETVLDNPAAADVVAAAETLPMMGDRRLVVVRDSALLVAGRSKDEAADSERLTAYLPKLPDCALVVFYCHGAADGRKKLSLALGKLGTAVKFDPLGDEELLRWMRGMLKAEGDKTIGAREAQHLAFTAGRDLALLTGELQKLAHYLGERRAVEAEDIDAVATRSLEYTVFQLVDALVEGQEARAFGMLAAMLENGEARLGILAMLLRQYRMLLTLKWMQAEGIDRTAQQRRLGVPPFVYDRARKQALGYTLERLKAAVALCVDTDFAVKSGRLHEEDALERAMLTLGG